MFAKIIRLSLILFAAVGAQRSSFNEDILSIISRHQEKLQNISQRIANISQTLNQITGGQIRLNQRHGPAGPKGLPGPMGPQGHPRGSKSKIVRRVKEKIGFEQIQMTVLQSQRLVQQMGNTLDTWKLKWDRQLTPRMQRLRSNATNHISQIKSPVDEYRGDPGYPGRRGVKGEVGLPGDKGQQGHHGLDSFPGRKGSRGEIGFPGVDGLQGPDGREGMNGLQGMKGEKGDSG